jgi:hypothetical protein
LILIFFKYLRIRASFSLQKQMSGSPSPTRSRAPVKKPVAAAKNPEPVKPPPTHVAAVPKSPEPVKPPPTHAAAAAKKPSPDHPIPKSKIPRPLVKQPPGKDAVSFIIESKSYTSYLLSLATI